MSVSPSAGLRAAPQAPPGAQPAAGVPPARDASMPNPEAVLRRYRQAKARRANWERHWQECYDFALPQRDGTAGDVGPGGERRSDRLFDATAPDGVEQLAASLLAELTPPWSRWFGLVPGPGLAPDEAAELAPLLDRAERVLQSHLDRSNFAVEMHQCYLDLVTVGTGCLLFEEAGLGEPSAFRFAAVPLGEAVLEEGPGGRLDTAFRRIRLTLAQLRARYPDAALPRELEAAAEADPDHRFPAIEAVVPEGTAYDYVALLEQAVDTGVGEARVLARGRFGQSPFVAFRWMKAPGEIYGRSPVMKALPDIKTANKVVELTLKNASIAVTGIWQADDDGVLNPASVKLQPGTIIPKAVGSAGLTPLQPAGKFDISQLVLEDLRAQIRHALLVDKLAAVGTPRMTATEVLERATEMSRLLGATFGRLQAELLTPLLMRAVAILRRRGEIPDLPLDGRLVALAHRSPLAQAQARKDLTNLMYWLEQAARFGPEALAVVDGPKAARWSAELLGVPGEVLRPPGSEPPAAPVPPRSAAPQPPPSAQTAPAADPATAATALGGLQALLAGLAAAAPTLDPPIPTPISNQES
jgi:hypothetical protein